MMLISTRVEQAFVRLLTDGQLVSADDRAVLFAFYDRVAQRQRVREALDRVSAADDEGRA